MHTIKRDDPAHVPAGTSGQRSWFSLKGKAGIPGQDHTTLCRRSETLEVPRPKPRGDGAGGGAGGDTGPMHLLVDSTGLKLYGAGEWLVEKHGTKSAGLGGSSISAWTPRPAGSWPPP